MGKRASDFADVPKRRAMKDSMYFHDGFMGFGGEYSADAYRNKTRYQDRCERVNMRRTFRMMVNFLIHVGLLLSLACYRNFNDNVSPYLNFDDYAKTAGNYYIQDYVVREKFSEDRWHKGHYRNTEYYLKLRSVESGRDTIIKRSFNVYHSDAAVVGKHYYIKLPTADWIAKTDYASGLEGWYFAILLSWLVGWWICDFSHDKDMINYGTRNTYWEY